MTKAENDKTTREQPITSDPNSPLMALPGGTCATAPMGRRLFRSGRPIYGVWGATIPAA